MGHDAIEVKCNAFLKNPRIRFKEHDGAVPVRLPYSFHPRLRLALFVVLIEDAAVAMHNYFQVNGERVDDGCADTVESSRDLVA